MKKLNRKGFTLIELMVVIAILVVIMGIALPNITSSIERSKQKQRQNKIQLIESAAELYFDRNKGTLTETFKSGYDGGIKVSVIMNDGLLTSEEVKDTCETDKNNPGNCCVSWDGEFIEVGNNQDCSQRSYEGQ